MKNSIYLFSLLLIFQVAFSSCGQKANSSNSTSKNTPESIRVMTYNVHHANPPEEDDVIDLDAIAQVIRESKADLVAVQELDSVAKRSLNVFQLKSLAQKLDMNYHYFSAIPFQGGAYGVGILSRFPISSPQRIALPEYEDKDVEDRVLGVVNVKLPNQKSIYFACTHWDVVHEENRLLQAESTIQLAEQLDAPIIIGGDFNARTDSKPMKMLRQVFTDASKEFAPTIPTINPNRKIDHILYAPEKAFQLKTEEVIEDELAQKASDHLPFIVELQLAN